MTSTPTCSPASMGTSGDDRTALQRGLRMAAHGPPDEPDGDQLGAAVRRAGRLGASAPTHPAATRRSLSQVPPASDREPASAGPALVGGRSGLRARAPSAPPRP